MTDHYRRAFENLPEAALTVASNGTVLLMNTAAERLFRFSIEELTGRPLETVIPEGRILLGDPLPQEKSTRVRLLASGIGLYGRRGSGEEFPISVRSAWFEDGANASMTCLVSEIQARGPNDTEGAFERIFELAPVGLIVTDDHERILAANPCAEATFGYSHSELVGCLLSALAAQRHQAPGSLASWKVDEHGWAWGLRVDGSLFPFRLSSAATRTASGMLHLYVIRDIPANGRG